MVHTLRFGKSTKVAHGRTRVNRAGHDKSVEKKISVLAQIFTKLWSIYELHNFNNYT